jgi:hypothetical protein
MKKLHKIISKFILSIIIFIPVAHNQGVTLLAFSSSNLFNTHYLKYKIKFYSSLVTNIITK